MQVPLMSWLCCFLNLASSTIMCEAEMMLSLKLSSYFTKTVSPVTYYGTKVHCGNSSPFEKKASTSVQKLNI